MTDKKLKARLEEFKSNVWNHAEDEFQASFDEAVSFSKEHNQAISKLILSHRKDPSRLAELVRTAVVTDPSLIEPLLQFSGLTRGKIVQDIKAMARAKGKKWKVSSARAIVSHDETWGAGSKYLAGKLAVVFSHLKSAAPLDEVIGAVSQATWPGFIRQERAKRSGHYAEGVIASVLAESGIAFEPRLKATNPLTGDIQIGGVSFDLVLPDEGEPVVVVKSTVHTSNIGQYGESKDELEIREAATMIADQFSVGSRPTLVAFIDGVGFESNSAGLNGVLQQCDEFCQFKTAWKIVAIAIGRMKLSGYKIALPAESIAKHAEFIKTWKVATEVRTDQANGVYAGEGIILRSAAKRK